MDYLNFSKGIHEGSIKFGTVSQEETVKKLREIADRIERNDRPKIALQEAYIGVETKVDDFVTTTMILKFAELSPRAKAGTKLFGGEPFPLEVAGD